MAGYIVTRSFYPSVCLSVYTSYAMRYLKCQYSDQLQIYTACVSYGSPHLKRLWSCSVDFLIFFNFSNSTLKFLYGHALLIFLFFNEFLNFYSYFPMSRNISIVLLGSAQYLTHHASSSYGFPHLIKIWLCSFCFSDFLNFFNFAFNFVTPVGHSLPMCASNGDNGGSSHEKWTQI